jgi:hypothetical protein
VDAGLDENQAELGVLVLAVTLKVLADSDGLNETLAHSQRVATCNQIRGEIFFYLLDQEVKVLGEFGSEACIPISLSVMFGPSRGLIAGAFLQPVSGRESTIALQGSMMLLPHQKALPRKCSLSSPDGCHSNMGSRTAGLQDTEDLVTCCAKKSQQISSSQFQGAFKFSYQ